MSKNTPKHAATNAVILTLPLPAAEKIFGVSLAAATERHALLTARERQVAGMMATGMPNSSIAAELGISVKTLDIHRANVMRKLEAHTTADVANFTNLLRLAEAAGARAE